MLARAFRASKHRGENVIAMERMRCEPMAIPDVKLVTLSRYQDARGWLVEGYRDSWLADFGFEGRLVQDNHSATPRRGTIRGLHFQAPPHAQAKLFRVLRGRVYDVAVDLRRGSPSYGRYAAAELGVLDMMFIPEGFAHGYCTLEDDCEVLYKLGRCYAPGSEGGVRWDDPSIAIPWPAVADPGTLSPRDRQLPRLAELESPFAFEGS